MKPRTVAVVGAINADLILRVDRCPLAGETVLGQELVVRGGGKAANQAVAAAAAGATVSLLGAVGNDALADEQLDALRRHHVDTTDVQRRADSATGVAVIVLEADGENRIVLSPGANSRLDCSLVIDALVQIAPRVVVAQSETGSAVIDDVARWSMGSGSRLVVSLGPVLRLNEETMRACDPLIVNEVEARQLLDDSASAEGELAALLRSATGACSVVVTAGARGAYWSSPDLDIHEPALPVEVVDTTGAGDAFAGTIAAALASGSDPRDGMALAIQAAAANITQLGARNHPQPS